MINRTDHIRKFYRGLWYPVLVAGLVFAGHLTGWDVPFAAAVLISAIPGLLVMHDAEFLLAPFMMVTFTVTARYYDGDYHYERYLQKPWSMIAIAAAAATLAALVWFLFRNRRSVNRLKQPSVFISLAVLSAVMAFNGSFNPVYTPKNLAFAAYFALSTVFVYLLFALYGNFDRTAADRFLSCVVVTGILILAELIAAYFTRVKFSEGTIVKESVVVGWGVWTSVGGMLAFLMPAPFYFARWHRHGWAFYLLGLAMFAGTLFSQSRGALLVGGVSLLICLALVCAGGPNRRMNRIFTSVLVAVGAVGALLLSRRFRVLIQNFADYGFGDNGRFALWQAGWKHFLTYPVFGSGFYDSYVSEWNFVVYPYLYHNTLVQMLAACGAAGLLAYLWHRFVTARLVLQNRNVPKTFMGVCILGLLLFSLIDVLFFKTYPTVIYAIMLVYMETSGQKDGEPL